VYLSELRLLDEERVEVSLRELTGLQGERLAPLVLAKEQAEGLLLNRVAVLWPGRPVPLRLDPLLWYRESETAEEVLFLNRDRGGRQVEYLSYTTGRTERDRAMAPALAALLSRVVGRTVSEADLEAFAEQSRAETPSVEMLLAPERPPSQIVGDYEILGEVGRGGMGVVYLARQLSLGRLVALKMLPADLGGDEVALARFRREVRHLARCEHPNIVKVLASGTLPDGRLYYAMEYVPGCDLESVWREVAAQQNHQPVSALGRTTWTRAVLSASRKRREHTGSRVSRAGEDLPEKNPAEAASPSGGPGPVHVLPLPPLPELPSEEDGRGGYVCRVVQLVHDAALALQAVHDQQIIHRDIKPANLMLTPDGSRPVLMDFGLAKGQSLALSASRSGGFLGTLRYAAPEQLAAASLKVGPPADVRGLGVTLWELLTCRRLFAEAEDESQLASLVHDRDVPLLRTVDPRLDRDLEAIIARATERRAADRIQTARQLADYLQLYLEGKPLPIRPPTVTEMAWRWVRQHKSLVGAISVAALLVLATAVTAFVLITRSRNQAVQAFHKEQQAEKDRALAQVDTLLVADPQAIPTLVEHLEPFRSQVTPRLRELWEDQELSPDRRLRVALALLPADPGMVDYLCDQLLAARPNELLVIREALSSHPEELVPRFWKVLEDAHAGTERRFRAACALAAYDPTSARWDPVSKTIAARLVTEDPLVLGPWTEALMPVGKRLVPPLSAIFRDAQRPAAERSLATTLLARYAGDQPEVITDLILDADPQQYAELLPLLRTHPAEAVNCLH
ncbi:MAG: serine/threonine protein kinase, partial [Planctomycetes bacterium]|nr:serine/threonine protein kinase [Planctomycetota bacterium]